MLEHQETEQEKQRRLNEFRISKLQMEQNIKKRVSEYLKEEFHRMEMKER